MFLLIFKKVVEIITGADLGFTEVKMYKGELEEGADYRDTFPICYVDFVGDTANELLAGDMYADGLSELEIYIADKDYDEPKILDLCTSIIDLFDGTDIEVTGGNYTARYLKTDLHAYIPGKGKAYKILIGIH